jgi:hypothetical protein
MDSRGSKVYEKGSVATGLPERVRLYYVATDQLLSNLVGELPSDSTGEFTAERDYAVWAGLQIRADITDECAPGTVVRAIPEDAPPEWAYALGSETITCNGAEQWVGPPVGKPYTGDSFPCSAAVLFGGLPQEIFSGLFFHGIKREGTTQGGLSVAQYCQQNANPSVPGFYMCNQDTTGLYRPTGLTDRFQRLCGSGHQFHPSGLRVASDTHVHHPTKAGWTCPLDGGECTKEKETIEGIMTSSVVQGTTYWKLKDDFFDKDRNTVWECAGNRG